MIPAPFGYTRAGSVDEALAALAADDGAKVIAGGQSLLPLMKLRLAQPGSLVDIGSIAELRGIRQLPDGGVEAGALTTYAEIGASGPVAWIREAMQTIGDVQVRNLGTIGGALAHADPASDAAAIGLASDGSVVLRSSRGERVVPLDGFFTGAFQTAIEPDELLVAYRRPAFPAGAGGAFEHLEQPASGYSMVGVAAVVVGRPGAVTHARVAITGVGEVPYRAKAVEAALAAGDAIEAAASHAADGQEVNSDIHAGREYRTAMTAVITRRALEAAFAAAG
jgi:carbon-monoxide dehydrogenase medium subunit